jgi:hypothetical protein
MIDIKDIAWAAGFIDGEGNFSWADGTPRVSASQKKTELLERLKFWFGGEIHPAKGNGHEWNVWALYSNYAIGLMMTLFPIMSNKCKKEIKEVITIWKNHQNRSTHSEFKTHCKQGHPWIEKNIKYTKHGNLCIICRKIYEKNYNLTHDRSAYFKNRKLISKLNKELEV